MKSDFIRDMRNLKEANAALSSSMIELERENKIFGRSHQRRRGSRACN